MTVPLALSDLLPALCRADYTHMSSPVEERPFRRLIYDVQWGLKGTACFHRAVRASLKTASLKTSQKTSVKTEKAMASKMSHITEKAERKYLATDTDLEVIGYVVPVFRANHEVVRGLAEAQDEVVKEEGVNYVAMRNLFVRESQESMTLTVEKKTRKRIVRESADSLQLDRKLEERSEFRKKMNSDSLCHPPEFVVRPRGQTVWEGRTLKLHCTVAGWPKPRVTWYKNNVLIDAKVHPEKYTTESNYNMHSLEIKNCEFLDTALYHASALNIKGESSATATIVIKRFQDGEEAGTLDPKPHGFSSEHGVTFETSILDKFEVAFGREGDTLSLGCTVIIYPTIKMYQPDVVWYRNSVALKASRWVNSHWSGQRATLTLSHLNKEDEGLYTLRINTKSGFDSYSAYVFVRAVPGKPSAVTLVEAAKDYMVLSWSAPASDGGAEITGYYLNYRTVKGEVVGKWHELNSKAVNATSYKAEGLKENLFYQFQVRAMNMAGVSKTSLAAKALECKEWTITVPGAPLGLHVLEVRDTSLVVLWDAPAFNGRSPVIGYYLDIKEAAGGDGAWRAVHEKVHQIKYMKVTGLSAGTSYVFRLRAENLAGVGKPSGVLGPILSQTRPGTHEIEVDVDDDGVISMIFQCSEMAQDSEFIWSKNYKSITDSSRITVVTQGGKSRAIFNSPSLEDLGTFSCMVTNTEGFSASYTLTEEALNRLLDISHEHKFPVIPFKKEMSMDLLEKGRVRFWTQVEKCTAACKVEYVFNSAAVTAGQKYSMNFDQKTGIIEMFMDSLEVTDEGTFTFNLVDGKAKGTTSLVLIGDEFRELQKKSEFERAEWVRKQGPHFVEYLGFTVTEECNVLLKCQIGNIKPETEIEWYKDKVNIHADDEDSKKIGMEDGLLTFNIGKISKSDSGVYEVKLRDERGKDTSTFDLTDAGYQAVMNEVFRVIANSSTGISVISTEHGIVLSSNVIYYTHELRVGWLQKESKITSSTRQECGVTGEKLWLKINEPTEKDKGKYTIDIFDGKDGLKRVFDLSGQAWQEAFEEFQRLKAAAIAERNRARVVGGLPDVVAIQQGK
ncbi:unnamed protein product, partial [Arctogadus glacialis]